MVNAVLSEVMIAYDVTRRQLHHQLRNAPTVPPPPPRHYYFTQQPPRPRGRSHEVFDTWRNHHTRNFVADNKRAQLMLRPPPPTRRPHSLRRVPAFSVQANFQPDTRPFTPAAPHRRRRFSEQLVLEPTSRCSPAADEALRRFQRLYEDRRFPIRIVSASAIG